MKIKTHPLISQAILLSSRILTEAKPTHDADSGTTTLTLSAKETHLLQALRNLLTQSLSIIETDSHPDVSYIIVSYPDPEIVSQDPEKDSAPLYWNNMMGWTLDITDAEHFTSTDYALPQGENVMWLTNRRCENRNMV
ncbi:hypothetical protein [Acetobacter pasteurianus]|uniref:hypothetical protein n=1 Tax=Acetobacter pasteurianus TaxID=438 RepID=UPI001362C543|nr:hypothetical protein [Acetobacter pasteurianus]QHM90176.1 hypothetical protein FCN51_00840 [Acetobacter pasteurianus]